MRRARKNKKKKGIKVVVIGSISTVLLLGVLVGILYKNDIFTSFIGQENKSEDSQLSNEDEKLNEDSSLKEEEKLNEDSSSNEDDVKEEPTPNDEENQSTEDDNKSDSTEKNEPSKPNVENKNAEDKPSNQNSSNDNQGSSSSQSNSSSGYIEGQPEPTAPTYINGIMLVNKKHPLPSTYNKGVDLEAAAALQKMIQAGKQAGFNYNAFSGFRSYEYQTDLYNRYVARDGKAAADRYSARPGYSEHQSGLAFDIGEESRKDLWLTEQFGETPAGKWLMENAHNYGFILRYPKGKEHITGFMYESWHYRYVGVEHAKAIHQAGITLEEYLNVQ